jgi:hypothetical protein
MPRGVHPIMKHANDPDTVIRDAKLNHMPLDIAAAVTMTNMFTGWSRLRRLGQHLECCRQQVRVPLGLFKPRLTARIFLNAFQVALGRGG